MARETKTIEISGRKYEIKQLGATSARRLFHRLLRSAGPQLKDKIEEVTEVISSSTEDKKLDESKAAVQLGGLFIDVVQAIPENLEDELFERFLASCRWKQSEDLLVEMNQEIFDDHFAGNVLSQDAWLVECMKHNFLGFLSSGDNPPS